MASEFPNNRKSMSLSRQTIYHSAEDLTHSASASLRSSVTPPKGGAGGGSSNGGGGGLAASAADFLARMRSSPSQVELERLNGDGDTPSHAPLSNGKFNGSGVGGGSPRKIDEVSERLLYMSNNKTTVTYSEWKSRVTLNFYFFHLNLFVWFRFCCVCRSFKTCVSVVTFCFLNCFMRTLLLS